MKLKIVFIFIFLVFLSNFVGGLIFFGDITLFQIMKFCIKATLLIGVFGLLAAFVVLKFSDDKYANGLLVNITVILTTCAILLIVGEYGFRYYYKEVTTTADMRSYFTKKWKKIIRYNRFNFRERDFYVEKSQNIYRIAVIGDSFTFGQGITEKDRFSNLLEKRLNSQNENINIEYEVLNFGRPGAETIDHINFLNNFVLPIKPDFILLQWYINDVLDPQDKKKKKKKNGRSLSGVSEAIGVFYNRLRNNSVLFYLLGKQLTQFKRLVSSKLSTSFRSFDETMLARFGDPNSTDSIKARSALKKFVQITKQNNIPIGMVLFSDSYFRPSSELDFLLTRLLDFCRDEKLICVDMHQPLSPYQGNVKLWASRLDPHPSAFANRIAADQIFAQFSPVWLNH